MKNILVINSEFIENFYSELALMHIELDADPLLKGPEVLNQKIAQATNYLSQVERSMTNLQQYQHALKSKHMDKSMLLEVETKHLLATDSEIRAASTLQERVAMAEERNQTLVSDIHNLNKSLHDLTFLLDALKSKRQEMKHLLSRIKDQLDICKAELRLGSQWGVARNPDLYHIENDTTPSFHTRLYDTTEYTSDEKAPSTVIAGANDEIDDLLERL